MGEHAAIVGVWAVLAMCAGAVGLFLVYWAVFVLPEKLEREKRAARHLKAVQDEPKA